MEAVKVQKGSLALIERREESHMEEKKEFFDFIESCGGPNPARR